MIVIEHVNINQAPLDVNNVTIYFDDIKNIDLNSLIINKKHTKNTNAVSYEIRYITECENIYEKIPLCLRFTDVDAYFIEENENKYLIFASTENNSKEVLKPYKKLWSETKTREYNSKSIKYGNNFMKIKFDLSDNLPLNKILHILILDMSIIDEFSECEYECEYKCKCEYKCG